MPRDAREGAPREQRGENREKHEGGLGRSGGDGLRRIARSAQREAHHDEEQDGRDAGAETRPPRVYLGAL